MFFYDFSCDCSFYWRSRFYHFVQAINNTDFLDIIAVFLLLFSSIKTIGNNKYIGLLCGAWGFEFCLNLRAWAWRFEVETTTNINENIDVTLAILAILLIISFLSFLITLQLNMKKS